MTSLKNGFILILLVIIASGGYQYYQSWQNAKQKIADAEQQKQTLLKANDALNQQVNELSAQQAELDKQIDEHADQVSNYKKQIADIQQQLEQTNLHTIAEVKEQKIADNFRQVFDLQTVKGIRVVKIPPEEGAFKITSLVVPIDYVKLAIKARNGEIACQKSAVLQDKIIQLNEQINLLTTEKLTLEKEKTEAYSKGYQQAFDMYLEINKLYVELLKTPPKVDLAPNWLQIAGGMLAGGVLCAL